MRPVFIKHRVNQIEALKSLDLQWGAEIDLRSNVDLPGKLHLSHDPWVKGDDFEAWLKKFADLKVTGPLILNTKEDGLEKRILELLKNYQVSNFFFLDTALPTLVNWTEKNKLDSFAVRYSRVEPREQVTAFKGKAQWLWIDCFNGIAVDPKPLEQLKDFFRICLVSPELQGIPNPDWEAFRPLHSLADAICTKDPEGWTQRF